MEKNPYQSLFLIFTAITAIVTVYNYLSQDEHRSIQKEIDKIRLADMKSKIAAGEPIKS